MNNNEREEKNWKALTRFQSTGEVGVLCDFLDLSLSKNLDTAVFGGGPSLPCRLVAFTEATSFLFPLTGEAFVLFVSLNTPLIPGVVAGDGEAETELYPLVGTELPGMEPICRLVCNLHVSCFCPNIQFQSEQPSATAIACFTYPFVREFLPLRQRSI